ncbi:hypothetical protein RvY_19405, partial [Ramazzottius varieornatus]
NKSLAKLDQTALTEGLARLTTKMFQRKVPDAVCGVLYGASLAVLKKKKDRGIRPIAVGNTFDAKRERSSPKAWVVTSIGECTKSRLSVVREVEVKQRSM